MFSTILGNGIKPRKNIEAGRIRGPVNIKGYEGKNINRNDTFQRELFPLWVVFLSVYIYMSSKRLLQIIEYPSSKSSSSSKMNDS